MEAPNLQAEWARVLLGSLVDAGLREVVVSPGSRSTPFLLAALAEERLRCRPVVDERSAAFLALGQAKVTGRPTLLLCTSGSAAANYFPAVVEARAWGAPLLVLTSDRPLELSDCGANQAIDQLDLFGRHGVGFFDLSHPESSEAAMAGLRRMAAQAFFRACYPDPGPVQLNARARKPLEPGDESASEARRVTARASRVMARPITRPFRPGLQPDPAAVDELAGLCGRLRKGLVVCGPGDLAQASLAPMVEALSRACGYPVLAEGASQLRFRPGRRRLMVDASDLLLGSPWAKEEPPELILRLGRFPTSSVWERYASGFPEARQWVLCQRGWWDPTNSASALVLGDPELTLASLVKELGGRNRAHGAWPSRWATEEEAAWAATEAEVDGREELSEAAAVRALVRALPAGALLAVGNSLAIRHLDRYCRGGGPELQIWSQRGASGIDGLLSGAAGAAQASVGPAALLVGDVSFLHDLGGLASLRGLKRPLVVVVLQNDGGRIFEQLPVARHGAAEGRLDFWLTPHGMELQPAVAMHGLGYSRAQTLGELTVALEAGLQRPGTSVVEAVVPPSGAGEMWGRLRRRFDLSSKEY